MGKGAGNGKVSSSLTALSCAAVLAVYAAGYDRTREAAEQFEEQSAERRPGSRQLPATAAPAEAAAITESAAPAEAAAPVREAVREAPAAIVAEVPAATPEAPAQAASVEPPPTVAEAVAPVAAAPAPAPVQAAPAPVQATASLPAPTPTVSAPAKAKWKDGTWHGWGTSRHGDIQAEVVIKDGKIVKSGIAQCLTRYSCDVIDILIPQPVQRQSPDVDYVSRSTQSSDAYYYAVLEALEASAK